MSSGLASASWGTLRIFVAVSRAGSITAAAEELGMAQASVSGQIQALEKHLGYRLFNRTRRGVEATDRGRELAALLSGPVDALSAVTSAAPGTPRPACRVVHLGGPAEFLSEMVLPGLVTDLPGDIRLRVQFGLADPLIEALQTGQLDLLVSAVQPRRPGVTFEPLHDEQFLVVGHPRWAAQVSETSDGGGLDDIPVLAYDSELQIIRRYWRSVFERRPDRLRVAAVVPDLRVLARLAAQGAGITVLPQYLARPYLARGDLVRLHDPEVPPLNTLYVASRRQAAGGDPAIAAVRSRIVALCRADHE